MPGKVSSAEKAAFKEAELHFSSLERAVVEDIRKARLVGVEAETWPEDDDALWNGVLGLGIPSQELRRGVMEMKHSLAAAVDRLVGWPNIQHSKLYHALSLRLYNSNIVLIIGITWYNWKKTNSNEAYNYGVLLVLALKATGTQLLRCFRNKPKARDLYESQAHFLQAPKALRTPLQIDLRHVFGRIRPLNACLHAPPSLKTWPGAASER